MFSRTRFAATRWALLLLITLGLAACSDGNENPDDIPIPGATFDAFVRWTEFGIPHITADDYGSLGYGFGYAYARENFCTVMREYVFSAGDSARYWGAQGDLNSDLVMKLYNREERVQAMIESLEDYTVETLRGYVAGLNRYLRETGVDNLAEGEEGCRGEPWVRELTLEDAVRLIHRTVLVASAQPLADFIVGATPPESMASLQQRPEQAEVEQLIAGLSRQAFHAGLGVPEPEQLGSNAYAIGEQAAQGNSGLLFGNPHFPWQGQQRFFMFHLTLPGEYDVMGAALGGLPAPVIGFTPYVAWSHTVSTGSRFNFYELTLNPENPLQYVYDGEMRDITSRTVTAQRMTDSGAIEDVEHTFYFSHFGAIVDLGGINSLLSGWPIGATGTLMTYVDANLENLRGLDQWVKMGQSMDLGEFKENLRPIGIPWVNTIAADRFGNAFYGDVSVNPHITSAQQDNCVRGLLQSTVTDFGFITMDGSDSDCELGADEGTVPGIFGYDSLPKLETREYGANANDTYWLPNPRNLLEGFPPTIGAERYPQSLRTRATFDQAEKRLAGTDGLGEPGFNIDNLRTLSYQATNYTAEITLDAILEVCRAIPEDPLAGISMEQQACTILGNWDRTHTIDSVGAHIFYELWLELRSTDDLWATPFDAADPVNTPRDLNIGNADVAQAVLDALTVSVETLSAAGIALDAPWGEVQFDEKNGERIPIHGGSGSMMFSVITSDLVDGEGYASIRHGNSYIQAITWDESDCPDAYAILTYSQSTDPASDHFADATKLYSEGGWIDMPFCEADQEAQELRRMRLFE